MSCQTVHRITSGILLLMVFCAVASAQTTYELHVQSGQSGGSGTIWTFSTLYNESGYADVYHRKPDPYGSGQPGVFYYQGDNAQVVLYQDDDSIQDDHSIRIWSGDVTIRSDTAGQTRTLSGNNSTLFTQESRGNNFYYNTLKLTSDIRIADVVNRNMLVNDPEEETPQWFQYGALLNQVGNFQADKTVFESNSNTNFRIAPGDTHLGIGLGGALSVANFDSSANYYRSDLYLSGTTFKYNQADAGGAVGMLHGYLYGSGLTFQNNKADFGGGGAIFASKHSAEGYYNYDYLYLWNAAFEGNEARNTVYDEIAVGDGGALSVSNFDLSLYDTALKGNLASGRGGAIFFSASDDEEYYLTLGASSSTDVEISGNFDSKGVDLAGAGTPNSIVFSGYDQLGTMLGDASDAVGRIVASIVVDHERTSLNMIDPMKVDDRTVVTVSDPSGTKRLFENAQNIAVQIVKSGAGTWNLGGTNELADADGGTKIYVQGGTFRLMNEAELLLNRDPVPDGSSHSNDLLFVDSGTRMVFGDGVDKSVNRVATSNLQTSTGSLLQIENDLELQIVSHENEIDNQSRIEGTISGSGDLIKTGGGKLTFAGTQNRFSGDIQIKEGTLHVAAGSTLETSGDFVMEPDAVLSVVGSGSLPNVKADNILLSDTIVRVEGVTGASGEEFLILQSNNAIQGGVRPGSDLTDRLDYITIDFEYKNGNTEYWGRSDWNWYSNNPERAGGTFTIDPETGPEHFEVGVVLSDRDTPPNPEKWNGKNLIKKGIGTLELSAANTYTGTTEVKEGTLLLTHSKGTGNTSGVTIDKKAELVFQFRNDVDDDHYEYDRRIDGEGRLVKKGENVVWMTGSEPNTYSGGTVLEAGVLAIDRGDALGKGQVVFSGGTLRSLQAIDRFDLELVTTERGDALLDVQGNLRVESAISGVGGLVKTGQGILTLAGSSTYEGKTKIKEGILAVANGGTIGRGTVVLSDAVRFRNEAVDQSYGNDFVLEKAAEGVSRGNTFDIVADATFSGNVSGAGTLHKMGEGDLILSGNNTYTGGTRLSDGTLTISNASNLGTGSLIFDGGILRNIDVVSNFSRTITLINEKDARFETDKDLTLNTNISGNGGLIKTGDATLIMEGMYTYAGQTHVEEGKMDVRGTLGSATFVKSGAVLTGSGSISDTVTFQKGAVYEWYCGLTEKNSPYLTFMSDVRLEGAVFRPIVDGDPDYYVEPVEGRTVMRYFGSLTGDGRFATIDNSHPLYEFDLDYSTPTLVKLVSRPLDTPRALSDAVAAGLAMAQRRAHRRPFDRIDDSLREGRHLGLRPIDERSLQRGQAASHARGVWGDIYGRTTEFDSSYYTLHPWRFNSFGFQGGYTFVSTNWLAWGITGGFEVPELENHFDKIEATDGYLGFYYGRRLQGMWEFKGYLGGGTQRYRSMRSDSDHVYRTRYYGESFQTNLELARPFRWRFAMIRPHVGFDLEYASQQASLENRVSSGYRSYSTASLTQLFVRVGVDVEKRGPRGDCFVGISYANMIAGDSVPSVGVYYPSAGKKTTVTGSNLGQNMITFRGGGNIHLDRAKAGTLFLDLTADMFTDRDGGQCEFTGTIGYGYRF